MKIIDLLEFLQVEKIVGNVEADVSGLTANSVNVRGGELFFAYVGTSHDSHENVREAIKNGAAAIVCERELPEKITQIIVKNGRAQVARAAQGFYGFADKKLKLVGVTGTNGKTTTTYMLASIFNAFGKKTATIGTLGISYGNKFISPELTTPDPIFLHSVFADMVDDGVEYVFMEVSAHAIYFDKIFGLNFEVGIFTNCSQDHLDFFKNMAEYAQVKASFFKNNRCRYAVINSDDELGLEILRGAADFISYGLKNPADVFAVDIKESLDGTDFVLNLFDDLYDVRLKMPAVHNVYNAMAAAACAKILGVDTATICYGLGSLKGVDGRLERVAKYCGADIFVDFAHTPDGLEKSLIALKGLCDGRLICMFGCGGNRDKTKRAKMGEVAARLADFVILTSDNPRYEDPYDIILDIEQGIKPTGKKYVAISERRAATDYAMGILKDGDILLVAGKGGEIYQDIMGIKHSYNDNTVIKNIIGS